jgi:hypothetical protein
MMRTIRAHVNSDSHRKCLPPREYLDLKHQLGLRSVDDLVHQALPNQDGILDPAHLTRPILNPEQNHSASGVAEHDDRSNETVRLRDVALELQRLSLWLAKQVEQLPRSASYDETSEVACVQALSAADGQQLRRSGRPSHEADTQSATQVTVPAGATLDTSGGGPSPLGSGASTGNARDVCLRQGLLEFSKAAVGPSRTRPSLSRDGT